jgi:hypothetical protein
MKIQVEIEDAKNGFIVREIIKPVDVSNMDKPIVGPAESFAETIQGLLNPKPETVTSVEALEIPKAS